MPETKLVPGAVVQIREAGRRRALLLEELRELSNEALARKWRVSRRCIEKVLAWKTWRDVL